MSSHVIPCRRGIFTTRVWPQHLITLVVQQTSLPNSFISRPTNRWDKQASLATQAMATVVYDGVGSGGNLFAGTKFFVLQRVPDRPRWIGLVKVHISPQEA
jgi:hypothetical protein